MEVHFVDRGGEMLLLTFNEMNLRADGCRFWADAPLEKLGISGIGFVTREPNFFPARPMETAIAQVLRTLGDRFPHRICYGMSQARFLGLLFYLLYSGHFYA